MALENELLKIGDWKSDVEVNAMWRNITSKIKEIARKVLEESKGYGPYEKERWW